MAHGIIIGEDHATSHEKQKVAFAYWVRRLLREIRHSYLLYVIVAEGPFVWRQSLIPAMRGVGVTIDASIADYLFEVLCAFVRQKVVSKTNLSAQQLATRMLDHVAPPAKPLTVRQIIDDLEVDSESSDDGRRELYGRDGSPQRMLEQLKDEMTQELTVDGQHPAFPAIAEQEES